MSSNLGWIPVKTNNYKWLDIDLKFALRKSWGNPVAAKIDCCQLEYLRGLRDAGLKDAQKLIDAIEKYGEIQVEEVF